MADRGLTISRLLLRSSRRAVCPAFRALALAHQFDELLRSGAVSDSVELARLAKVTQPRITQVMSLLYLAPDIQEELLFLPLVMKGRDPINERQLRGMCRRGLLEFSAKNVGQLGRKHAPLSWLGFRQRTFSKEMSCCGPTRRLSFLRALFTKQLAFK